MFSIEKVGDFVTILVYQIASVIGGRNRCLKIALAWKLKKIFFIYKACDLVTILRE